MTPQKTITIEFKGLSMVARKMHILELGHRDFWETFHLVSQAMAGGLKIGKGKIAFNPLEILRGLDFESFETIASKVLSLGVLEGVGTVQNPFDCGHFRVHPDELYSAVYAAITALNPDMFAGKKKPDDSTPQGGEVKVEAAPV